MEVPLPQCDECLCSGDSPSLPPACSAHLSAQLPASPLPKEDTSAFVLPGASLAIFTPLSPHPGNLLTPQEESSFLWLLTPEAPETFPPPGSSYGNPSSWDNITAGQEPQQASIPPIRDPGQAERGWCRAVRQDPSRKCYMHLELHVVPWVIPGAPDFTHISGISLFLGGEGAQSDKKIALWLEARTAAGLFQPAHQSLGPKRKPRFKVIWYCLFRRGGLLMCIFQLRCNWHVTLCTFKEYNVLMYILQYYHRGVS